MRKYILNLFYMIGSTNASSHSLSRYLLVRIVCIVVVALALYIVGGGLIAKYVRLTTNESKKNYALQTYTDVYGESCNIAVVRLENNELYATDVAQSSADPSGFGADALVAQIEQAKEDDSIAGVLLEVDSPGGSPTGGEMISKALKALGKPSVALIYDEGDSAAYFAATGATTIIASPFSSVGDIGVTSSFVNYAGSNAKAGNTFEQISSGKYKDAGNPDKALTAEELALLRSNVSHEYDSLVAQIAQNRNMSTTTVTALADGSAVPGSEAIKKGLIDALGDATTAKEWFKNKIGHTIVLCDPKS